MFSGERKRESERKLMRGLALALLACILPSMGKQGFWSIFGPLGGHGKVSRQKKSRRWDRERDFFSFMWKRGEGRMGIC